MPLRVAPDFFIAHRDPNPVGMEVVAADGYVAGDVREVWVDRSEPAVRYLEVETPPAGEPCCCRCRSSVSIAGTARSRWYAITAAQFADVPAIKNPDQVTRLEEDKITAYFAGGHLYAMPHRQEPLI